MVLRGRRRRDRAARRHHQLRGPRRPRSGRRSNGPRRTRGRGAPLSHRSLHRAADPHRGQRDFSLRNVAIGPGTGSAGHVGYPRRAVNWVDLVLLVAVVVAAVHGLRLGALVQVLTFGGFWLGLTLGALLSIALVSTLRPGPVKSIVTLVVVLAGATAPGRRRADRGGMEQRRPAASPPGRRRCRRRGGGGRRGGAPVGMAARQRAVPVPLHVARLGHLGLRRAPDGRRGRCPRCPRCSLTCRRS